MHFRKSGCKGIFNPLSVNSFVRDSTEFVHDGLIKSVNVQKNS